MVNLAANTMPVLSAVDYDPRRRVTCQLPSTFTFRRRKGCMPLPAQSRSTHGPIFGCPTSSMPTISYSIAGSPGSHGRIMSPMDTEAKFMAQPPSLRRFVGLSAAAAARFRIRAKAPRRRLISVAAQSAQYRRSSGSGSTPRSWHRPQ